MRSCQNDIFAAKCILQIRKMFFEAGISVFVLLKCPGATGNIKSFIYLNTLISYKEFMFKGLETYISH